MHAFLLRQASDIPLTICRFTPPSLPQRERAEERRRLREENRRKESHNASACQIERNTDACSRLRGSREITAPPSPPSWRKTASAIFSGKLAFAEEASVPETQIYYSAKLAPRSTRVYSDRVTREKKKEKFPTDTDRSLLTPSVDLSVDLTLCRSENIRYLPEISPSISHCAFRRSAFTMDRLKRNFALYKQNEIIKSRLARSSLPHARSHDRAGEHFDFREYFAV